MAGPDSQAPASRGVAVVIGLALLLVLTLLALASVRSARVERGSAARAIAARAAFEAAERGLKAALAAPPSPARVLSGSFDGDDGSTTSYRIEFDRAHGLVDAPAGFSLGGGSGFIAYPFAVTATGTANGRSVRLREDVLVMGAADE